MYPILKPNVTPLCDEQKYQTIYAESISNTDKFWADQAQEFLHWEKQWDKVSNVDYNKGHSKVARAQCSLQLH